MKKSDAELLFIEDVRQKKSISRSYRNKRTRCGKGGAVRLPSDKLTKKELQKMNGPLETYRLNQPMKWPQFLAMPVEHQISYVKKLREKYNVPDTRIARMLQISQTTFSQYVRKLGIPVGTRPGYTKWDQDRWYIFCNGAAHDETVTLDLDKSIELSVDPVEETCDCLRAMCSETEQPAEENISDEEVAFILEQTKSTPPETAAESGCTDVADGQTESVKCAAAIPETGTLTFTGDARSIVNTLTALLGDTKVLLTVKWDVVD